MKIDRTQCIYVIYNPVLKITKVGISNNVLIRKTNLECSCGCRLVLSYFTDHLKNARVFEEKIHTILSDKRGVGEWFNITPEEAEYVIKNVLTDAVYDPMISQYREGISISKIAEDMGVTRQAIIHRLRDYGLRDKNIYSPQQEKTLEIKASRTVPTPSNDVKDYNGSIYLDEDKPNLPLSKLKRIESNINFNGEWYQISVYRNGGFSYAYTRDINKAREYIHAR